MHGHDRSVWRSSASSLLLHGVVLLGLVTATVKTPRVVSARLPGTKFGNMSLTYYSPGGPPHQAAHATPRVVPAQVPAPPAAIAAPSVAKPEVETPASKGTGSSTESGLGDGDLRIALPTYAPPPKPSLATLASGTKGDVVLDAVIDERGRISQLTLLHGLGTSIDSAVMATVQNWTYTPATKDGKPVASGQELHFHYERS